MLWLDKLPLEIRSRIAVHVWHGQQSIGALYLAETNDSQREAVMCALRYKLELHFDVIEPLRWSEIFRLDVCDLSLTHPRNPPLVTGGNSQQLFTSAR